jgi:hypothetical protein
MTSDNQFDNEALDDDDEAAMARFREAEERLRNTPPRCLAGFKVEPATLSNVVLDGHGSANNKIYKLACACGHERFRVLGHPRNVRGHALFVSPLALDCAACGTVTELIDTDQHGYDAELGHGSTTLRGEGPRTHYACNECGVRPMIAYARFEHSGGELEDSFMDRFPNTHDYFSWFSLVGSCEGCRRTLNVADYECA